MNNRLSAIALLIPLFFVGCRTVKPTNTSPSTSAPTTAAITQEGFLTCFAAGTSLNNQPVWCEASAVLFDGKHILFANDKDMPSGQSPVFLKTPEDLADSTQSPTYLTRPIFTSTRKYEDFAQTPDRRFVFLTTAFDRIKPGSHDWDSYNTILYWRNGDEHHPNVLAPDDTSRTSIAYRDQIAKVLATNEFPGAMPYFKIEGLAATDRQLLFGIREEGKSYDSFNYRAKIISVSYTVEKKGDAERIRLSNDWKIINDFDIAKVAPSLPSPLALSSLEYDPYRGCFWLLTSLEAKDKLDAYLWTITPADLYAGKPFTLMRTADGQPVHTPGHKAEDVTPLDKNRLFLISDDDRMRTTVNGQTRQPNQAAYAILTVN
ncbi:hypothetical protein GCM10028805_28090 [Spirosoma harenae]